jgi:hypothetical protein
MNTNELIPRATKTDQNTLRQTHMRRPNAFRADGLLPTSSARRFRWPVFSWPVLSRNVSYCPARSVRELGSAEASGRAHTNSTPPLLVITY